MGILADGLKDSLALNAESLSLLSSSFYYSYVFMQIPVGIILDRFGVRRVSTLALLFVALALGVFAISSSVLVAVLARIMMGVGCAFGFLGVVFACGKWFPPRYFALMVAGTECLGMVGVAGLSNVLSELVIHFDWRITSWVCAVLALVIAVAMFIFSPKDETHSSGSLEKVPLLRSMRSVISYKEVWLGGFFAFALFSIVTVFAGLWGIPFLMSSAQLSLVGATSLLSMIYVGSALASPLVGWLTGIMRPTTLMIPCTIITTILMFAVIYGSKSSLLGLYILIFSLGFASSVYQLPFAIVNHALPNSIKGVAMGITNMICMLGGPVLQPIIGYFLGSTDNISGHGFEAYSVESFQSALLVLPICVGLGIFLALNLREKR